MTITEFLAARLNEREAAGKAAKGIESGNWLAGVDGEVFADADRFVCSAVEADATHMMLNDPAYVLADVAAKRKILDSCTEVIGDLDLSRYGEFGYLRDHPRALAVTMAVETLRSLAAVFATHQEYRQEWKP